MANAIDIPNNTLGNWVTGAAQALAPLGDALWQQLLKVHYVQADETPVKMLYPNKKGFMWAYHSPGEDNRFILYEFALSRAAAIPNQRLGTFQGLLQTDGDSGYHELKASKDIISLGCWDHARRKFTDAIKVAGDNKKGLGGKLLSYINRLYYLERQTKNLTPEERYHFRQQKAKKIIEKLYLKASDVSVLPKSSLGKAVAYLLNQKSSLIEYLNHGQANISNCWVENLIRPLAVGRKNWLFLGNEARAADASLLYSLIQTCKLNDLQPRLYLNYVLKQVHAMIRGDVDPNSLLPQFIDRQVIA